VIQERYLSPDGKYAVEITGDGGAAFPCEVFVGLASSRDRQSLGKFGLPIQGSPSFFDDNSLLVIHTGSLSSGTWPIIFLRTGQDTFKQAYAFDHEEDFHAIKTLNKLPTDYEIAHLYIEVTGFRKPDILELSFRGDRGWSAFKPIALDFSLATKRYLDTDRVAVRSGIS